MAIYILDSEYNELADISFRNGEVGKTYYPKDVEKTTVDAIWRMLWHGSQKPTMQNLKELFNKSDFQVRSDFELYLVGEVVKNLKSAEVSMPIIRAIEENLQWETNEEKFCALVEAKFEADDQAKILKALEIARQSHEGQFYAKPGEETTRGLDAVPYVNHCVVVATLALQAGLSPEAVQAALLHDTVEDTDTTIESLKMEGFSQNTLTIIQDLTIREGESRDAYLERTKQLKGVSKIIKHFDRYDNLMRAFTRKNPEYHARYIQESKTYFMDGFLEIPELEPQAMMFDLLLKELDKYRKKILSNEDLASFPPCQ